MTDAKQRNQHDWHESLDNKMVRSLSRPFYDSYAKGNCSGSVAGKASRSFQVDRVSTVLVTDINAISILLLTYATIAHILHPRDIRKRPLGSIYCSIGIVGGSSKVPELSVMTPDSMRRPTMFINVGRVEGGLGLLSMYRGKPKVSLLIVHYWWCPCIYTVIRMTRMHVRPCCDGK